MSQARLNPTRIDDALNRNKTRLQAVPASESPPSTSNRSHTNLSDDEISGQYLWPPPKTQYESLPVETSDEESDGSISPPPSPVTVNPTKHEGVPKTPYIAPPIPIYTRDPNLSVSFYVMGSGGSAAVPDITCITNPESGCAGCLKTIGNDPKAARNNTRGNTGGVIRIINKMDPSKNKTILIDCGKTFREKAIQIFRKKGFRKIDAVFITHDHADAASGIDNLRAWTYKGKIEESIPIYCSQSTYDSLSESYKYLIVKNSGSGGGALPAITWNVFKHGTPLDIFGIRFTPLAMNHGIIFETGKPLICSAFLIDQSLLYISDVSYITAETWQQLRRELFFPGQQVSQKPRLAALIIDCTSLEYSNSHFGLPQAISTAWELDPKKTYLTDMAHGISHEAWVHACENISDHGTRLLKSERHLNRTTALPAIHKEQCLEFNISMKGYDVHNENWHHFSKLAKKSINKWMEGDIPGGLWVRPLADDMTISWDTEEGVWDDEYQ